MIPSYYITRRLDRVLHVTTVIVPALPCRASVLLFFFLPETAMDAAAAHQSVDNA